MGESGWKIKNECGAAVSVKCVRVRVCVCVYVWCQRADITMGENNSVL